MTGWCSDHGFLSGVSLERRVRRVAHKIDRADLADTLTEDKSLADLKRSPRLPQLTRYQFLAVRLSVFFSVCLSCGRGLFLLCVHVVRASATLCVCVCALHVCVLVVALVIVVFRHECLMGALGGCFARILCVGVRECMGVTSRHHQLTTLTLRIFHNRTILIRLT